LHQLARQSHRWYAEDALALPQEKDKTITFIRRDQQSHHSNKKISREWQAQMHWEGGREGETDHISAPIPC